MGFSWVTYSTIVCNLLLLINYANSQLLINYADSQRICPFDTLYNFGDSTSDTGNAIIRVANTGRQLAAAHLPYGETFPGRPTGRWSDGLLIADYIASALGLPLLKPYFESYATFQTGVNFAVAGSTALDFSFLAARGLQAPNFTAPLSVQLNWFRTYLRSICSTPRECEDKLRTALFLVGDIGNNDIGLGLNQGKSVKEIKAYIPLMAEAIANGTKEAILLGARRLVVPGTFPLGCLPTFLNTFPDRNLDELGCSRVVNDLAVFFNDNIQARLDSLRGEFPNAVIVYADNYNTVLSVIRRAPLLGFDQSTLLKSCCGEGPFYFEGNKSCGAPGVPVCPNPDSYINWDGIHYTQEAHRRFSEILIPDIRRKIGCFQ